MDVRRFEVFVISGHEPIVEIVVVADPREFLELESSGSVYGLELSYAQTPRAISAISDETIARFRGCREE